MATKVTGTTLESAREGTPAAAMRVWSSCTKWVTPLVLSACLALLPGEVRAQFSCSTPIRFHFVALSDASGGDGPTFGPNDVQPWITAANTVIGTPAGVQFQYRSNLDWEA